VSGSTGTRASVMPSAANSMNCARSPPQYITSALYARRTCSWSPAHW
jgi:hypothetical protein